MIIPPIMASGRLHMTDGVPARLMNRVSGTRQPNQLREEYKT